jgi:hypothetical protein
VFAVVEHQQRWLRFEQGHDGGLRVVDRTPQPQGDGHGVGDGLLTDGGQVHRGHGPARAVPVCHLEGKAGLAHPSGPKQGDERLGATQPGYSRQLGVATDQGPARAGPRGRRRCRPQR